MAKISRSTNQKTQKRRPGTLPLAGWLGGILRKKRETGPFWGRRLRGPGGTGPFWISSRERRARARRGQRRLGKSPKKKGADAYFVGGRLLSAPAPEGAGRLWLRSHGPGKSYQLSRRGRPRGRSEPAAGWPATPCRAVFGVKMRATQGAAKSGRQGVAGRRQWAPARGSRQGEDYRVLPNFAPERSRPPARFLTSPSRVSERVSGKKGSGN